ncbi:hypothetical protein VB773_11455 [Haloarculaceae archaeon H-GB2-1]|nr:hypothetical protein [Haloarculaceae archaeon H-GB1-1]MEA5386592.1 hypothetical protein [Haloarculaceae archaeon H-GB11]MEA5408111.1 hypothetical protein [Haloarculaceae archaeon H-GB2-1]
MSVSATTFEAYLAPGETVVEGVPGSLLDSASRSEGTIGVTDRRILFVADGDEFLDVSHDSIHSIRSTPQSPLTQRGLSSLAVVGGGSLLALVALLGVFLLRPSALVPVFLALYVAGVLGAEYVRRYGVDLHWVGGASAGGRSDTDHRVFETDRLHRTIAKHADNDDLLVVALVVVALVALAGLIALTESLLVLPLSIVLLGGVGVSIVGIRRGRALKRRGIDRHDELEVSIHLSNGHVVRLRVEGDSRLDRELSGVARRTLDDGSLPDVAHV